MLCFSLPVQPSQADKRAFPSPACQFAMCWTYIFINLTLTKLFTVLQGQPLPGVTAQSSTEVRQLMTIPTSWGLARERWVVSDALIPHEARSILDSCPFSGQLEDCIVSPNISGWECFSAEVSAAISAESSLKVVFIERGKGKTTSLFWNVIFLLNYLLPLLLLLPQVFFQVKCP